MGNRNEKGSAGQASVEYLVALAVVGAVIGAQVMDASPGATNVLSVFLDAVRTAWANLLGAISLPA